MDRLINGFRHYDRQLRNDLLVIATLVAENSAASMIVSIQNCIFKANSFSIAYLIIFTVKLLFVILCLQCLALRSAEPETFLLSAVPSIAERLQICMSLVWYASINFIWYLGN